MKRTTLGSVIIALSLLGLVDAWYLAEAALTHTALTCDIAGLDGCNVVAQSPYSHIFGIPLGVYGLVFYALMLAFASVSMQLARPWLERVLATLALSGALASVWFLYIQFGRIHALCVYCLASAGISFVLAFAAVHLARQAPPPVFDPSGS